MMLFTCVRLVQELLQLSWRELVSWPGRILPPAASRPSSSAAMARADSSAQRAAYRLLLATGILLASAANADTPVSGAIAVNTHWTAANSPYVVSGDVVVQNGALLTIDAGVTVYMGSGTSLTVQSGGILAQGTAASLIRVESDQLRQGLTPAPGDWKQWVFGPGTVGTELDYVTIEYGSGLAVKGSAPVFNYLNLRNHQGAAVTVDLAASPTGVGNQASGNSVNGVAVPAGDITGSVTWGLRGIPYVVSTGVVSVGSSPTVTSLAPISLQQGSTVTVNVTGVRLTGLSSVRFGGTGLSAQVLAGGTDAQASISITADTNAPLGASDVRLLADAGEILKSAAITVVQSQPTIASLNPSTLYVGQGAVAVSVTGTKFTNQTVALVNGTAVPTQFVSGTQLSATFPAQTVAGTLTVKLRTPDPLNSGQYLSSNEVALTVSPAQLVLTPATTSAVKGGNKTFTLALPYPAPTGGVAVNLVSSVPSVATVPATVTVAAGTTTATFQLSAIDLGNTTVTASGTGFVSGQAQVTVIAPPNLTIAPIQVTTGVGRTADITIQSSVPAGVSGLTISLSSSNTAVATVPASVTIPAGNTSATVTVTTAAIGTATIQAQATDFVSGSVAITVRPISLNLPAGVLVAPGLTRSVPITLSDPAPASGLVVTLTSSNTAVATAPASITVPAGQTTANFTLTGVAVGSTSIGATASGYQAASMPATVDAVTISIGSPAVSSISLPAEITNTYAVTLSRPAPAGGVVVGLSTGDASKAIVSPSSITIPEGQTSGGVVLATVNAVAKGTTTLVASAPGLNAANINVTITSKARINFSTSAITVGKGLQTYQYEVYLRLATDNNNYNPTQNVTVSLTGGDTTKVTAPATVTVPAGQYYTYFTITGVDLTNSTPVTVDATATSYDAPTTKLAVNVVNPTMSIDNLDGNRATTSPRDDLRIQLYTPGANYSGSQPAVADIPINLSIVEDSPSGLVPGVYDAATGGNLITHTVIKAGQTNTYACCDYRWIYVATPTSAGTYKVRAEIPGTSIAVSGVQTVALPDLKFSTSAMTVGKGLQSYTYEVYVYRSVNGNSLNGTDPVTVNLTSGDSTKASVPATVTIPAGQYYTYFPVTGVGLTNGTPVTIDATATGYNAPTTKLAVNVVNPTMSIDNVDANRATTSARNNIRIQLYTPGANYSGSQTAVADIPINLSIVEDSPSGIIPGFYDAATGGNLITQTVIKAGQTNTYACCDYRWVYVGTPTAAGTYKIKADILGASSATTGAVTVTAPSLVFSRTPLTVGKGLQSYYYEVYVYRVVNGNNLNGTDSVTVNLTSSDATKVSVPATVTIPAGQYYAYFTVNGVDLTNSTPVTVDATATGYNAPTTKLAVNVVNPTMSIDSLDGSRATTSARDNFRVQLYTPNAYYSGSQPAVADMPINLSIVEASPTGIVPGFYDAQTGGNLITQGVVKAGDTGTSYLYVDTPVAAGTYKVRSDIAGGNNAVSGVQTVTAPDLKFSTTAVTVGKGLQTYFYEVYIGRSVNGSSFNGTDAVTVNLVCNSTAICTVPASVTIPAGSSSVYFYVQGVDIGNTTISASATGYNSALDLAVNVVTPQLNFSGPNDTSAGNQSGFSVYLTTPGAYYSGNQTAIQPMTVNLTSSAPGVATVPATATITVGNAGTATVYMTAVAAGTTTLTASGPGLSSATSRVVTVN